VGLFCDDAVDKHVERVEKGRSKVNKNNSRADLVFLGRLFVFRPL